MTDWKTVVIGLETQVPYHNKKVTRAFIDFISAVAPDRVVGIGDHLDCPAPARWNRGTAEEYAGALQSEINQMKTIQMWIRDVYDGPLEFHEGNHERRIATYARTKAPAFAALDCLAVAELLDYKHFAITELPAVAGLCRGWVTTHDLGGLSKVISSTAGGTALGYARRVGKSVICGHTHRLGHIQETSHGKRLHGVESGHMMGKASYTLGANWQVGWVVFEYSETKQVSNVTLVNVEKNGKVHYA